LVLVGRSTLWGATVAEDVGVARAIQFYREEISRTMAYLGCRSVSELNRNLIEYTETPHLPLSM